VADDLQREGEALDLEDDWADVRPAPDPEDVLRWAAEDAALGPNPCAEIDVPRDGIDQLAQNLGVDREVLTAIDAVEDSPRTISAWVRTASDGQHPIMSDAERAYALRMINGHVVFQEGNSHRATSFRTFNDGEWHHIVVVGSDDIYVDGEGLATATEDASDWTDDNLLPSSISEVAVWDRELAPTEVAELYGGGEPPNLTGDGSSLGIGLSHWFRMGGDTDGVDHDVLSRLIGGSDPEPTPFDEPFTTETVVGFEKIKATHDCQGLEDGEVCPICGRVYYRPRSRYELLMNDEG